MSEFLENIKEFINTDTFLIIVAIYLLYNSISNKEGLSNLISIILGLLMLSVVFNLL